MLDVAAASVRLRKVVKPTPLQRNAPLSKRYNANIYLKREDLQTVRSYKIRGAYNMISQLRPDELARGVVCASAGNHAQGFAFSCHALNVHGVVFMPVITPKQKINQTKMFGGDHVEVKLVGDSFDDCAVAAMAYTEANNRVFIPPFDDLRIIEGQATVGLEILEDLARPDYVIFPVGGGGLSAGAGSYIKHRVEGVKIIGTEPAGAPSMKAAMDAGHPVVLDHIDRFVDGAAVKRVGDITFNICKDVLDDVVLVPEGKICTTILNLYNSDAIVVEPAGALSIAALDFIKDEIAGKDVVCIVSGSNNDIDRMPEIKEKSLQFEGLKHYFLIHFAQRPGALKEFVNEILGPNDDITRFEYMLKTNKETAPALVGVELEDREDYYSLLERMQKFNVRFTEINKDNTLFGYLV